MLFHPHQARNEEIPAAVPVVEGGDDRRYVTAQPICFASTTSFPRDLLAPRSKAGGTLAQPALPAPNVSFVAAFLSKRLTGPYAGAVQLV